MVPRASEATCPAPAGMSLPASLPVSLTTENNVSGTCRASRRLASIPAISTLHCDSRLTVHAQQELILAFVAIINIPHAITHFVCTCAGRMCKSGGTGEPVPLKTTTGEAPDPQTSIRTNEDKWSRKESRPLSEDFGRAHRHRDDNCDGPGVAAASHEAPPTYEAFLAGEYGKHG